MGIKICAKNGNRCKLLKGVGTDVPISDTLGTICYLQMSINIKTYSTENFIFEFRVGSANYDHFCIKQLMTS